MAIDTGRYSQVKRILPFSTRWTLKARLGMRSRYFVRNTVLPKNHDSTVVKNKRARTPNSNNKFGSIISNNMCLSRTCTINSFNAAFIFLSKESEQDYVWALTNFALIGVALTVVVTNRELALMRALQIVFPEAANRSVPVAHK
jgi:hypothetical protein